MFKNSTLFGTSFTFVKTAPKIRGCGTFKWAIKKLIAISQNIVSYFLLTDQTIKQFFVRYRLLNLFL
jgi:hypothetical protein